VLGWGDLTLHLDNGDGSYNSYGQVGATYEALERGSRLELELGLHGTT
jgi:hypothetical protein